MRGWSLGKGKGKGQNEAPQSVTSRMLVGGFCTYTVLLASIPSPDGQRASGSGLPPY